MAPFQVYCATPFLADGRHMANRHTDEQLEAAIAAHTTFRAAFRSLGVANSSRGSWTNLRKRVDRLGLDISHFTRTSHAGLKFGGTHNKRSAESVLVLLPPGSDRVYSPLLRRAMLESGIEFVCALCGLDEWCGSPLPLQADHIDGNCLNNVRENLRFLCPNCHSVATVEMRERTFTQHRCSNCNVGIWKGSTFCNSCANSTRTVNRTLNCWQPRVDWPPVSELIDLIEKSGYLAVGRHLGVSDNAVRKHLRTRGVTLPAKRARAAAQLSS